MSDPKLLRDTGTDALTLEEVYEMEQHWREDPDKESYREKGLALEALRLMLSYVTGSPASFASAALSPVPRPPFPLPVQSESLVVRINQENRRSIRLFERLGFVETSGVNGFASSDRSDASTMSAHTFGHIPGFPPGTHFKSRLDLLKAGVHGQLQAGISGSTEEGAYSICLSGGYEDNEDFGEKIIYVGSGGQEGGQQNKDQSFEDGANKSLLVSSQTRRPVRVTRGRNKTSHWSPSSGFRYDGLYVVDSATMREGKSHHQVCIFELRRIREEGDRPLPSRRLLTMKKLQNMGRKARK